MVPLDYDVVRSTLQAQPTLTRQTTHRTEGATHTTTTMGQSATKSTRIDDIPSDQREAVLNGQVDLKGVAERIASGSKGVFCFGKRSG